MTKFKAILLAAVLFGALPAVSGACDGPLSRLAERKSESVFGFGLVKARPVKATVVVVQAAPKATKAPAQAPAIKAVPKSPFKCADGCKCAQ